jgi:hypothetical protein
MPAAWQASGVLLGALTTADVTPVNPAHAVDDILICITANRVITNTCLTPSTWTLLHGPIDSTGWRTYVFYRRATVTNTPNPLCDWTATSADKYAQVHSVRGAIKTGSPFAASNLVSDLTDPISNAAAISSTLANQLIIVVGIGSDNASVSVTVTGTDPATYTQRHFSTIGTGADATGSFHDKNRVTAGAVGTVVNDHNATMPAMSRFIAAMLDEPPPAPRAPQPIIYSDALQRASRW